MGCKDQETARFAISSPFRAELGEIMKQGAHRWAQCKFIIPSISTNISHNSQEPHGLRYIILNSFINSVVLYNISTVLLKNNGAK